MIVPDATETQAATREKRAVWREGLPLVVFPHGSAPLSDDALSALSRCANRYLPRQGAILFRGFNIGDTSDFARFAGAFGDPLEQPTLNDALSPAAPRPCSGQFVRARAYGPRPLLWLHWAARPRWDEALIVDHREIYRRLSLAVRTRFLSRGLRRSRILARAGQTGWQAIFHTALKSQVENACRTLDIAFTWLEHEQLLVSRMEPAVFVHPVSNEPAWLNHRLISAVAQLGQSRRSDTGAHPTTETRHADGAAIDPRDITQLRAAFDVSARILPLEAGDILMVDPRITWHVHMPHLFEPGQLLQSGHR